MARTAVAGTYFLLFLFELLMIEAEKCKTISGLAGMQIAKGTQSYEETDKAAFQTSCDCGSYDKKYWKPSTEAIPKQAYYTNQLAFSCHSFTCPDLCICDINDKCYTRTSPWVYVELVPHCSEDDECYVYGAVYYDRSKTTQLQDLDGNPLETPNPLKDPVGPDSGYIKVKSISCKGCMKKLNEEKCKPEMIRFSRSPYDWAPGLFGIGTR